MRIAILTFHRAYNCGAALQAWALKRVLEKNGHRVAIADCNLVGVVPRFRSFESCHRGFRRVVSWFNYLRIELLSVGPVDIKRFLFRRFCQKHLNLKALPISDFGKWFDKIVIGSDQVWNPDLMSERDLELFYGETLPVDLPKVSYAASIGDRPLNEIMHNRLVAAASMFEFLSVRERLAGTGLKDKNGRMPEVVLDPSLLVSKDDYLEIACAKRLKKERYVLVYALFATDFVCQSAEQASKQMGLPVVILVMYQYGWNHSRSNVRCAFGPAEFLAWFRDAECVVALSFHGTAFSVIFDLPFVSLVEHRGKVESRPASFLRSIGEGGRCAFPDNFTEVASWGLRRKISDESRIRLRGLQQASKDSLRRAIDEK